MTSLPKAGRACRASTRHAGNPVSARSYQYTKLDSARSIRWRDRREERVKAVYFAQFWCNNSTVYFTDYGLSQDLTPRQETRLPAMALNPSQRDDFSQADPK